MESLVSVYSIFDRVANEFGPLFLAKNDGVAIRAFRNGLREARAEEYVLYQVATFDTVKGCVEPVMARSVVIPPDELEQHLLKAVR